MSEKSSLKSQHTHSNEIKNIETLKNMRPSDLVFKCNVTLPEFHRMWNLIATAINRLSVNMSNQRSKTTDFSLGLYKYLIIFLIIFKMCLRRPYRGQSHTVWAGLNSGCGICIRTRMDVFTMVRHVKNSATYKWETLRPCFWMQHCVG